MMVIEETPMPDEALPVDRFKAHLRLGTGFGEDSLQDDLLKGFLRAALSAIEARTGKVLITRDFSWIVQRWRTRSGVVLPVAPVQAVSAMFAVDAEGDETALPPGTWRLEPDAVRPVLRPVNGVLPLPPEGGAVRVAFSAGMAGAWGALPADLGQAVMLLAAHYYEYREDTSLGDGCMPFGVTSLLQRYRPLRLGPGAVQ